MLGAIDLDWSLVANVAAALGGLRDPARRRSALAQPRPRAPGLVAARATSARRARAFVLVPALLPLIFGGQVDERARHRRRQRCAARAHLPRRRLRAAVDRALGGGAARRPAAPRRSCCSRARCRCCSCSRSCCSSTPRCGRCSPAIPDAFLVARRRRCSCSLGALFLVARLPREVRRARARAVARGPAARPAPARQRRARDVRQPGAAGARRQRWPWAPFFVALRRARDRRRGARVLDRHATGDVLIDARPVRRAGRGHRGAAARLRRDRRVLRALLRDRGAHRLDLPRGVPRRAHRRDAARPSARARSTCALPAVNDAGRSPTLRPPPGPPRGTCRLSPRHSRARSRTNPGMCWTFRDDDRRGHRLETRLRPLLPDHVAGPRAECWTAAGLPGDGDLAAARRVGVSMSDAAAAEARPAPVRRERDTPV